MAAMPNTSMLSYTQESLWLLHEMVSADEPAYNESVAFEIQGHLNPDAFRHAVQTTVQRHEALRTSFLETPVGPRAQIHDAAPDAMRLIQAVA